MSKVMSPHRKWLPAFFPFSLFSFIPDRYNVPEFGLYDVPLSEVLEYVYHHLVPQREAEWEVVVLQRTIRLPEDIERLTRIGEDSRMRLRIVDKDILQLTRVAE